VGPARILEHAQLDKKLLLLSVMMCVVATPKMLDVVSEMQDVAVTKVQDLVALLGTEELVRIVLFCNRHGMSISARLAGKQLRLDQYLPATTANELAFIMRSLLLVQVFVTMWRYCRTCCCPRWRS
jgi:hypothetical protein